MFIAVWWLVWRHFPAQTDPVTDLLWLGVFSLLTTLITALWVLHNISLYRRKGPRRSVPSAFWDYSHDVAGRPVDADFDALRTAQVVTIELDGAPGHERKRYAISPERP